MPSTNDTGGDSTQALRRAAELFTASGITPTLRELNAMAKLMQEGENAKGIREDAKRKDNLEAAKYFVGLGAAIGIVIVFFVFCPVDKRYDLIEKLVPFLIGGLGGFGIAKARPKE